MRNIVFIILDKFADWESAFLAAALNNRAITENYTVSYASTDKKIKTSIGNLKVLPDITIDEISENVAGLILIGADKSWRNLDKGISEKIINLVKKFKNNGKTIGAICDGAYFLAVNGLLNDCRHTVNSLEEIKNDENYTNSQNYIQTDIESVIDKKIVTAKGDSPVHFAANVMRALGDISEETIEMFYNIYTIGFDKAMMKK